MATAVDPEAEIAFAGEPRGEPADGGRDLGVAPDPPG
jgi:hypothetical protein